MLELPIEKALGVSQSRLALLKKLKIETIEDLICYYPRGYEDRSQLREIASLKNGENCSNVSCKATSQVTAPE